MTASWVFGPMFVEEDATPFPIVAADGVIYVGFGKGVYALTPDKTVLWSYQTGNQIISNPALAGKTTSQHRRHGHPVSGLRRFEAPRDLERAVRPGLQSGGPGG